MANPWKNKTVLWDAYREILKEKTGKDMARTNKYQEYSETTQQYMMVVEKYIKSKYGKIETQWLVLLRSLAINIECLIKAEEQVKQDGVMVRNRFGGFEKHPMLKQITDSTNQLVKLSREFGLSPNSIGKIKQSIEDKDEKPQWMENLNNDD